MFKFILPLLAFVSTTSTIAQNTFKIVIKDSANHQILKGATAIVKGLKQINTSDTNGVIILKKNPIGKQIISVSFIGYETMDITLSFSLMDSLQPLIIYLKAAHEELEQVMVSSTRTSRTIATTPTRIETIDQEEIDEKTNMKPANVSMILHESTGIQVQQTSATSGNASVRIQGLDGRYTQLLKDGYANFGNFASGLSILEIPPLDLKQVEIIKGPASTLYGAGAIAGVVNFVSKLPKEKDEYNFIVNQSNVGQTNIGGFASHRNKKIGYTILANGNFQKAYDVDKDNFTELPKSTDFTIHPKLFLYPTENATIIIGNSFSKGYRMGGDIQVINGKPDANHTYFETNNTIRNTATFEYNQKLKGKNQFVAKTSYSYFSRNIGVPNYNFKGTNYNSYTDISYSINQKNQIIIIGGNLIFDQFTEQQATSLFLRHFTTNTVGAFVQHTWDVSDKLKLETGLRSDLVHYSNQNYNKTEVLILPRISILYKFNNQWSSRVGGGLGYKTPTIFTEQTETIQYQNVLPLNNVTSEKSYGATADLNFKTKFSEDINLSINQLFFYTKITYATVMQQNLLGNYYFLNTNKPVTSLGFETNAKIIYKEDFKLFIGYTFTHAKAYYLSGNQFLPLLPKSKLNLALVYEKEQNFKIGLEAYLTDNQYLTNGNTTPSFWEMGTMVEKTLGKLAIFINAENISDVRQSKYKPVVNPPHNNPNFDEIWTHTEGRTFNVGLKLKL
ncbi:MAG: TonB-dependent receptor [Pedobacter sp.]|nr:TonB-dependent receptor [Chitinophagaceae bacterium]